MENETAPIAVRARDLNETVRRTRIPDKPDPVIGTFWFTLEVTTLAHDIYLPVSIASGKKPTGFVYQIEGTAEGSIVKTDISCRGDGITQVTLGTLVYCKIPAGSTALFRIRIEVRGKVGKEYQIAIRQINYKRDPGDTRYQKVAQSIRSKQVRFK